MTIKEQINLVILEIEKLNKETPGSPKIIQLTEKLSKLNNTVLLDSKKQTTNKQLLNG